MTSMSEAENRYVDKDWLVTGDQHSLFDREL